MSKTTTVVAFVSGLVAGAFIGYVVTERVVRKRYDEILDDEVTRVESYYKGIYEDSEPEEVVFTKSKAQVEFDQNIIENELLIESLGYSTKLRESEQKVEQIDDRPSIERYSNQKMTLAEATPIDYESPEFLSFVEDRNIVDIHVLTVDEFMDERKDYDKLAYTYYEADEVLMDERNEKVEDIIMFLGESGALTQFGVWSRSEDIVHVRNPILEIDLEVVRDDRAYSEVVLRETKRTEDD